MTIAIAWTRRVLNYEQLLFVSDSRISGGATFDACPKVLTLPRTDCAVAFAGYEGHAFPMMLQLGLAIDAFPKAKRGAHEISRVCKHALRVFDTMATQMDTTIESERERLTRPDANFLFGGYSWRNKAFQLWSIGYSASEKKFRAHPAPQLCYLPEQKIVTICNRPRAESHSLGRIALAGDQKGVALERLKQLLLPRLSRRSKKFDLNMEPFEVVRDMLRDPSRSETIGGAPQVVKVFQYLRSASFGVYWPNKEHGVPHLHGRPVLPYEALDKQAIDPDTLEESTIRSLEAAEESDMTSEEES
jgi:hypothetical protein